MINDYTVFVFHGSLSGCIAAVDPSGFTSGPTPPHTVTTGGGAADGGDHYSAGTAPASAASAAASSRCSRSSSSALGFENRASSR